jgi:hypothetical protein
MFLTKGHLIVAFCVSAGVLLRCWPKKTLKPNAGLALTYFLITVLDPN